MSLSTPPSHGEVSVEGYCVYCRSHRQMLGAIQVSNRRGGRDLKGICAVCGKPMYRLGGWDALAPKNANAPEANASESFSEQADSEGAEGAS